MVSPSPRASKFDDDLFERIGAVVERSHEIPTLSIKRINRIAAVDYSGIYVETDRSDCLGTGPQHVPAWMVVAAWQYLRKHGELTQEQLLNDLNVKRSAFVCALLAQFDDVVVVSTRPTVLELVQQE